MRHTAPFFHIALFLVWLVMRDRRASGVKQDNIAEICENMCAASADSEDFLLPTDASAAIA